MQNLFSRFKWQSLSIQAKTGLLFALQLLLISAMALSGLLALSIARGRTREVITTTVETRILIQEMQLKIEDLGNLQTRLVGSIGQPDFDPLTTNIDDDFAEAATALLNDDIPRLEVLLTGTTGQEGPTLLGTELRTLESYVIESQNHFDKTFALATQLSHPDNGALILFQQRSAELETLALQRPELDILDRFSLMQTLESNLVDTGSEGLPALQEATDAFLQTYNERTPIMLRDARMPEILESYLQQAETVGELLAGVELENTAGGVSLNFMRVTASRINNIAEAETSNQLASLDRIQGTARLVLLAGLAITLVFGSGLTYLFGRDLTRRLASLLDTTRQYEAGNLDVRAELVGEDEFSQLSTSFNAMAVQLASLVGGLEQRVAERTRDLSITAEIGQAAVALREPRALMNEVVELIRRRFGFYHAQVFLVDDAGENANLVASTGTAGRELLARQHYLPVGSLCVIGQVTATGEPVIASDTSTSAVYQQNELLPDTRSEMALPMRIGDKIIGALDVQSVAPNAFDADSVAVFQILADQLAISLENARLFAKLEDTEHLLASTESRMTGQAWQTYRRDLDAPLGYQLEEKSIQAHKDPLPEPLSEAIRSGLLITNDKDDGGFSLAIPIRVRGEVIGAFGFGGEGLYDLTEDDLTLIEAIVDRVGLALENLRLIEDTARRAEHEQIVNAITAKIVGSTDVNHILQTTVKELGRILHAPQTSVQLRQLSTDESHE